MLLSITPNPCVERIISLDDLRLAHTTRVASSHVREVAGGKGLNAARVASTLGTSTIATGWFGRDRAAWFAAQMESGVEFSPVEVESPTRIATQYRHGGQVTQVIEDGRALSLHEGTRLLQHTDELLPRAKMMILGGSYPPSQDERFPLHASLLCGVAARHGVPVIYDGSERAWEIALRRSPPWCIAPNIEEMSALLRRRIVGVAAEQLAIETVLKWNISVVLLTCGERGAWLGTREQTLFLSAPRVSTVSSVGCGDALSGAFASKYLQGSGHEFVRLREAARFGVAAGAAQARSEFPGALGVEEIESLLPQVRVQQHLLSLSPK